MSSLVEIYTDGAALGNPGRGGYGVLMCFNGKCKEIYQGFRLTTNNRMELLAVIVALENMKRVDIPIKIFSDSKYVVDSISKRWVHSWVKKNFLKKKNSDLWKRFIELEKKFQISIEWVKGHNGHPQNERCDQLAVFAANQNNLLIDEFYEKEEQLKQNSLTD